jgi:hypothetical protein
MFQAYRKKQTTTNFREKMNKSSTGKQLLYIQSSRHSLYETLKKQTG